MLLSLLAQSVVAETPLTAASVLARGENSVQARLGGLSFHDPWAEGPVSEGLPSVDKYLSPPPLPETPFILTAPSVKAVTYVNDYVVHAVTSAGFAPRIESRTFLNATILGTEVRRDYWISVSSLEGRPAPEWVETSNCAEAKPSSATLLPIPRHAGSPELYASIEGAVSWGVSCDLASVRLVETARHIKGDFLLTLWQWDARVESESGMQLLPSGQQTTNDSIPGYPTVGIGTDRQVHLIVTNGDLRLPELAEPQAFLFQPQVHSLGNIILGSASGFLAATGKNTDGNVSLVGDLTASLIESRPNDILLNLDGTLAGTPATVLIHPPTSYSWLWLLSLPALAAIPMWLVWRKHRQLPLIATAQSQARAMELFGFAETFAFEGSYGRAKRLLNRAIRLQASRPDFFALRARCLAMLGDTDAALRDHRKAHDGFPATDPDAKASNAYEAARTCNLAGRREEALAWLHLAGQHDPYSLEDARDDPALVSLFNSLSGRPRRVER